MRKCSNCKNRLYDSWTGPECCGGYEMAETEAEEIEAARNCKRYEEETEEERYCPSATAGDYSPSCPWEAPGCSVSMFI